MTEKKTEKISTIASRRERTTAFEQFVKDLNNRLGKSTTVRTRLGESPGTVVYLLNTVGLDLDIEVTCHLESKGNYTELLSVELHPTG